MTDPLQAAYRRRGAAFCNAHQSLVTVVSLYSVFFKSGLLRQDADYLARARALAAALHALWAACPQVVNEPGMFPPRIPYVRVLREARDLLPPADTPTHRVNGRHVRPRLTYPEMDWIALNPEGLTAQRMAALLDRSTNAIFKVRQRLRDQAGIRGRSPRNGGLDHLEPRWTGADGLPDTYAHRDEAALRWNELYHAYAARGAVEVSGPHRLMPARI